MRLYLAVVVIFLLMGGWITPVTAQGAVTIDFFSDQIFYYDFTPDGRYIAATRDEISADSTSERVADTFIDVFQVSDFTRVATYDIPDNGVELIAISHDARLIAYVQQGGLYVLDRTTGAITQKTANFYQFEALEFNPVNDMLAYVIGRGITVFDPTNSAIHYDLLDEANGNGRNLAWSPNGRYLATGVWRGGENHDVVVWDMTLLQPGINRQAAFILAGGEPVQVSWRDNDTLASFGSGGVSIFDVPSRSLIVFIPNPAGIYWSRGAWSPDGTQLIAAGGNRASDQPAPIIQVWNVSNLPNHETVSYQEGIIGADIYWLPTGLFYASRGGVRRNGEFLVPQLTATAQFTPPTVTSTPTATLTATLTSSPTLTFTPTPSATANATYTDTDTPALANPSDAG